MVFDRETETQTLLSIAIDGYLRELGLKDSDRHLLEGEIEFRDAEPGVTLLRESYAEVSQSISNQIPFSKTNSIFSAQDVCLLYILSGSVSVLQENIGFPGSKNPSNTEVFGLL